MSIDRSLKIKGSLKRHRNVLNRGERIDVLKNDERWSDGDDVMGLPKVAHRKAGVAKKEKAAVKTEEVAAAVVAQTPAAAAPAPGKK